MPNWCSNTFSIRGNKNSISDLWVAAELKEGLLEAIAPIGDWEYGNAVETWGTKWDVSLEGLQYTDHGDGTAEISGYFDSAWSPPIGAYEQLAADFDSCIIEASYFEPGMDFAGFWSSENGEEHLDNLHDEWEKGDEASDLYKQLDDEYNLSEQFQEWDEEFAEIE